MFKFEIWPRGCCVLPPKLIVPTILISILNLKAGSKASLDGAKIVAPSLASSMACWRPLPYWRMYRANWLSRPPFCSWKWWQFLHFYSTFKHCILNFMIRNNWFSQHVKYLKCLHIILLHINGSTNPLGICSKMDSVKFYPKFIIKDIFGFFTIIGFLSLITVFFYPNALGHPDNYIKANAMITPPHIVPEFYFLPFYAILRAIPNKLMGVVAMFSAILILFFLPILGSYNFKRSKFRKIIHFFFWVFVLNFLMLGWLGSCIVEEPYISISQYASIYYFFYFVILGLYF